MQPFKSLQVWMFLYLLLGVPLKMLFSPLIFSSQGIGNCDVRVILALECGEKLGVCIGFYC